MDRETPKMSWPDVQISHSRPMAVANMGSHIRKIDNSNIFRWKYPIKQGECPHKVLTLLTTPRVTTLRAIQSSWAKLEATSNQGTVALKKFTSQKTKLQFYNLLLEILKTHSA